MDEVSDDGVTMGERSEMEEIWSDESLALLSKEDVLHLVLQLEGEARSLNVMMEMDQPLSGGDFTRNYFYYSKDKR